MTRKADFPCFVCGQTRQKGYFSTGGFDFWRCRECGLVRMHPLPSLGSAGEDYQGFDLGTYKKFMETFRVPQYERELAWLGENGARGRLLDVGNWKRSTLFDVNYEPRGMTAQQLREGLRSLGVDIYSPEWTRRRRDRFKARLRARGRRQRKETR